jgi:hypothetical protein
MAHSKPSTTTFQPSYINEFPWVKEDPNSRTSAICTLCKSVINISGMGKTALRSHAKSSKHSLNEKNKRATLPLGFFFKVGEGSASSQPGTSSPSTSKASDLQAKLSEELVDEPTSLHAARETTKSVVKKYLLGEEVTKSEIFWILQIVMNHLPFRVAARCAEGFKAQFPDSEIASKIQLSRTKVGYTVVYGLAPYFEKTLTKNISDCTQIVLCFDESLNKVSQRQQMDLHIRFWDPEKKRGKKQSKKRKG